jgi:hypothetical protein
VAAARRALAPYHLAIAADLLGVAKAALARTVGHVLNRTQFGQPIGRFQSVKHRLADCHTVLANARLAVGRSAMHDADWRAATMARVIAAEAALKITSDAIQLHGALGFSWESDLHLYFKRARRLHARSGGTESVRAGLGEGFIESMLARSQPAPESGDRRTGVDDQDLPGHARGLAGGQEQDFAGDLVAVEEAEQVPLANGRRDAAALQRSLDPRAARDPGGHGVDPDAVGCESDGKRSRQGRDAAL